MDQETFNKTLEEHHELIQLIRGMAHKIHADVNQHYDKVLPYSVHLDAVADNVKAYGAEICARRDDVVPMMFGAYFHDSIEDARLTYNNVLHMAQELMTEEQALMAAEIVYALTNEKGRNRAERANDRYYAGIRATAYAPLCKLADRLANVSYSVHHGTHKDKSMRDVYADELSHFMAAITVTDPDADRRLLLPPTMVQALETLLSH